MLDAAACALLGGGRFVLTSVGVASPGVPPALHGLVSVAKTADAQGYQVGHHYLVRPDGYIALGAPGDDASAIFDRLQRLMPP